VFKKLGCDQFTVTERADQLHRDNAPAHSTVLVQAFFGIASHHTGLSALLQPRFGSLRTLVFPKAKIAVEREEICKCDGHTVHKLSQRRLTAEWLAPRESDCSLINSKVSSDWLPSYIKAARPVLEIFKMAGYFPDSPCVVQNNPGLPMICLGFRFSHDATCDWRIIGETPGTRWKKFCYSSNVVRNLRGRCLENGRGD
jgi:hypothetical protein